MRSLVRKEIERNLLNIRGGEPLVDKVETHTIKMSVEKESVKIGVGKLYPGNDILHSFAYPYAGHGGLCM